MIVAHLRNGRVGPWFPKSEPPKDLVEVPDELFKKYKSGEIRDGFELAQRSLAYKAMQNAPREKPVISIADSIEVARKKKATKDAEKDMSLNDNPFGVHEGVKLRT